MKFYSIPGTTTSDRELKDFPEIKDVNFGRARSFSGKKRKANMAGYRAIRVVVCHNDESHEIKIKFVRKRGEFYGRSENN